MTAVAENLNIVAAYSAIETAGRAEAYIVYDILTQYLGVSPEQITVENKQ